jgi:hypothetical protein
VIGVRTAKVKALIHQARTTLIAEREARETPCEEIREQLATARGGALRRGPLRRHLRLCAGCQAYREAVGEQRRALALVLPVTPGLGLKASVLGAASAGGGAGAAAVGGVASLGGGLAAKVVAGAIVVGGTTAGGIAVVDAPRPAPERAPAAAHAPAAAAPKAPSAAAVSPPVAVTREVRRPATTRPVSRRPAERGAKRQRSDPSPSPTRGQGAAKRSHGKGPPAAKPEKDKAKALRQPAQKARGRPAAGGPPGLAKKQTRRATPPRSPRPVKVKVKNEKPPPRAATPNKPAPAAPTVEPDVPKKQKPKKQKP